MNLDLTGKHALVCGGSQGIGRAAAIELARSAPTSPCSRARVRRSKRRWQACRRSVATQQHASIAVDMREHADLRAKVEATANAHPVQILINNTGGPPGGPRARGDGGRIPARVPPASDRQPDPAAGGAAGHERRRLRPHRQRDLDLGEGADPQSRRVQHDPRRDRELGQDPGRRTRRRTASPSTTCCPATRSTQRLEQILAERAKATGKSSAEIDAGDAGQRAGRPLRRSRPRSPP